jgi:hypothetical protein
MLNWDFVHVNIILDYRRIVLLCCINVRQHVLITLRLALLSSVTAMLFTFTCCRKHNLTSYAQLCIYYFSV